MEKKLGEIMHGFSDQTIVPESALFENMPSFPRISRSSNLTMLLADRVKSYSATAQGCRLLVEAVYLDEKYTYRYLDYRQVFTEKANKGTIAVEISFINSNTVRVTMAEGFDVCPNQTEMIKEMLIENVPVRMEESDIEIRLTGEAMAVVIHKNPWNLSIINQKGKKIYKQFGKDSHSFMPYEVCPYGFLFDPNSGEQYACEAVCSDAYEELYGLGENFTALNRKGRQFDLWNTNSLGVNTERGYKYIPFYFSSDGYGVFYNTSRKTRCDMGATLSKANAVMVEGKILDYFVIAGETAKEILPFYYRLTGFPMVPPKWSFGIWMSKISYGTQEEVERVSHMMREQNLPCDVIHIDTDWFAENWVCDWKFDRKKFPEAEKMIESLHKQGYKISLWQLPYIERGKISYEVYDEGVRNGYFATNINGDMQFPHGLIDFTNPEAVNWYKEKLIKPLLRMGIDVIKVDFGESAPSFFKYAGKDGKEMHNLYSLLYNKAVYEATKEELGEEKALIWARSAWAGSQKYPVHWGGDAGTDFGSLASSVKGCLNLSLSGIPFWSSDIGGFWFDSNPTLYIRWMQFGMFCSHARFHGFHSREPWDFGEEAVELYRKFAEIRYRLLPYIYNQAIAAQKEQTVIHRPLMYEYPEDIAARGIDSEYLFGKDLLVIPVLNEEGYVRIYLPEGKWTDFYTDEFVEGGRWLTKVVPISEIPLYVRENGILPMGEAREFIIGEKESCYEIHCYPGIGSNQFSMYEDDFQISILGEEETVSLTCTPAGGNITFVVHHLEAEVVQINGYASEFSIKKNCTWISLNSEFREKKIHILLKRGRI